MKIPVAVPLIGSILLFVALSGCANSGSFAIKVTIDAPFYAATDSNGLPGKLLPIPVGQTCQGGSESDTASLSVATLDVQNQHGNTVQSQVIGNGKTIAAPEDILQMCRFVVIVDGVPTGSTGYRIKVGHWVSDLAPENTNAHEISMTLLE